MTFPGLRRHIPNALSDLRVLLSPLLLVWPQDRLALFLLILAIGASDALDGWLARRWKVASPWGARLDSMADYVFFACLAVWLLVFELALVLEWWPLLASIAVVRLAALLVGAIRYRRCLMIHTRANKAAGIAIFLALETWLATGAGWALWLAVVPAAAAALEELLIILVARDPEPDLPGLWATRPGRPRQRGFK